MHYFYVGLNRKAEGRSATARLSGRHSRPWFKRNSLLEQISLCRCRHSCFITTSIERHYGGHIPRKCHKAPEFIIGCSRSNESNPNSIGSVATPGIGSPRRAQ